MYIDKIENIFLCPVCEMDSVSVIKNNVVATCCNIEYKVEQGQIVVFDDAVFSLAEAKTRDNQAQDYLIHSKFPTQIDRMNRWMLNIPKHLLDGIMLDLGCGPGPTTKMLLDIGARNIFAVDFSIKSRLRQRSRPFICKI